MPKLSGQLDALDVCLTFYGSQAPPASRIAPGNLSIHQDCDEPHARRAAHKKRQAHHQVHQLAAQLGIPCIRLNSGGGIRLQSFDDLMRPAAKSRAPGFTETMVSMVHRLHAAMLPKAEEHGVFSPSKIIGPHRTPKGCCGWSMR